VDDLSSVAHDRWVTPPEHPQQQAPKREMNRRGLIAFFAVLALLASLMVFSQVSDAPPGSRRSLWVTFGASLLFGGIVSFVLAVLAVKRQSGPNGRFGTTWKVGSVGLGSLGASTALAMSFLSIRWRVGSIGVLIGFILVSAFWPRSVWNAHAQQTNFHP
jgi:hypothetical protein